MHNNLEEHMFMMKVQEWFNKAVDFVSSLYHRQDVQDAIAAVIQAARYRPVPDVLV